jgi:hypothetical protein
MELGCRLFDKAQSEMARSDLEVLDRMAYEPEQFKVIRQVHRQTLGQLAENVLRKRK